MIGITLNGDWVIPFDDSEESESRLSFSFCLLPFIIIIIITSLLSPPPPPSPLHIPIEIEINSHSADKAAAQQVLDISIGWFADPIYLGHYPPYMKTMLGERALEFSESEWEEVRGSSEFYGMNTYVSLLTFTMSDWDLSVLVWILNFE